MSDASLNPGSLLIVDDEELWRGMLTQFLKSHGFAVTAVADGRTALQLLDATHFDLVLLDMMMPDMDGAAVLQEIRKSTPAAQLPVIKATVLDSSRSVVNMLTMGANDYVTKPFDFPVVLARLNTLVSLKRQIDEIIRLEHELEVQNTELQRKNAAIRVPDTPVPCTCPRRAVE